MFFNYNDKKIYYEEIGDKNNILLFLHGNTVSSLMFKNIINLYSNDYKIILIDFLGSGKSERVNSLNIDLWYDQAIQVITLLDMKKYKNINIVGTSGGALTAINVALERPDLVNKIVADSFEGEEAVDAITANIIKDREDSKMNNDAKMFYYMMNGSNWEKTVDADTHAIFEHSKKIKKFFHKDISLLDRPILFTGSKEDEFLSLLDKNYYELLFSKLLKKVDKGKMHIFKHGGHPAMLTNAKEFSEVVKEFLK